MSVTEARLAVTAEALLAVAIGRTATARTVMVAMSFFMSSPVDIR
jgi:hypothetical protein